MESNNITQAGEVTPAWIRNQMETADIQVKKIVMDTGVGQTNISQWIHGRRNMSKPVKAMFYFYFLKFNRNE